MKAIETVYRGVRFRSRLEARWAVFFDARGIAWEYEPEGFELLPRLNRSGSPIHYLPDFRLPELDLWAEVKGALDVAECERLLECAAALSSSAAGGCAGHSGDVLVLGHFTNEYRGHYPIRLHLHKGDLNAMAWPVERRCSSGMLPNGGTLGNDAEGPLVTRMGPLDPRRVIDLLLTGVPLIESPPFGWVAALDRARSARFEHGASG